MSTALDHAARASPRSADASGAVRDRSRAPGWQLTAVYTGIKPADVFEKRGLTAAIWNDALSDTTPLWGLISRFANQDMLAAIGREYEKGRLLLIGTTDLDDRRPVIWNIGLIAAGGQPAALDLFRKILPASGAISAVFPPVLVDVEVNDRRYLEMRWRDCPDVSLPARIGAWRGPAQRDATPNSWLFNSQQPSGPRLGNGRALDHEHRARRDCDNDPGARNEQKPSQSWGAAGH
jgi:hypothetical protein